MRARILVGAGAWLVGVVAATGGSLLAVSLLGEGIAGPGQQQLTSAAVNRALAGEAHEPRTALPPAPRSASAVPRVTPGPSVTPGPASSPSPLPTSGTLLTSPGGTVVAACAAAGAYLVSWSPQQGYEVAAVARGPAPSATVRFGSGQRSVTMVVTCAGGVPTAVTYPRGGDD